MSKKLEPVLALQYSALALTMSPGHIIVLVSDPEIHLYEQKILPRDQESKYLMSLKLFSVSC